MVLIAESDAVSVEKLVKGNEWTVNSLTVFKDWTRIGSIFFEIKVTKLMSSVEDSIFRPGTIKF